MEFGDEDDLPEMHREVFDDVIERLEHRQLSSLNGAQRAQIRRGETREHRVSLAQHALEIGEQPVGGRAVVRGELAGAVTSAWHGANTGHDPLPDVAGEVEQQIADAVRLLVRSPPERASGERFHGGPELG